jgi:hypothetical protein
MYVRMRCNNVGLRVRVKGDQSGWEGEGGGGGGCTDVKVANPKHVYSLVWLQICSPHPPEHCNSAVAQGIGLRCICHRCELTMRARKKDEVIA